MLLVPVVFGGNPILDVMAKGLRTPALVFLGVGALLLVLHAMVAQSGDRDGDAAPQRLEKASRPKVARTERKEPVMQPFADVAPSRPASWDDDVLTLIEWRRFEALVEALFAQAGFETRSQSHGADGGVDIWLHSKNAEGPVAVVQCKHWEGKPVGVREMREFLGVMTSNGLKRGTYATSSIFTTDALAFAKANGINAQDGRGLLKMIRSRSPEQQAALLAVATEGEYWRPTCASCGVKMVERTPKSGGAAFWGCVNFPRCRATLPMRSSFGGSASLS